ncbi:hypothetical protein [Aureimonas sp. ME7]|uniref:hypothetical protein n=1 Tax=Aureimonas sp. ME7 TaxID=2744252 RepID=UPI0015F58160|nr:hypothetical protein [Aureimonas sp. ME7]
MTQAKITTGANDRPRDVSIGQTADGLPDDSGRPVQVSDEEIAKVRDKLLNDDAQGVDDEESEAHPS